MGSIRAAR